MRKFEVYVSKGWGKTNRDHVILEFANDTSELEIEEACEEAWFDLIASNIDSGWFEIEED